MIFIYIFITFFEIGLFGFGGGYGMLSLIQNETVEHWHWLTASEFTDIVAISQMTPGPIGINSATYAGYTAVKNAGFGVPMAILGSATATFALVLPSLILMILISKMFMKYMNTQPVQSVFKGLRPAVVGLLAAATLLLCTSDNFSYQLRTLCSYCFRHWGIENQSHPHDLLQCRCRITPILLIPTSAQNRYVWLGLHRRNPLNKDCL